MLTRNLVYTGLTKAKKLAVLVGPKKAIAIEKFYNLKNLFRLHDNPNLQIDS